MYENCIVLIEKREIAYYQSKHYLYIATTWACPWCEIYSSRFNRSNATERNAHHLKQLLSSILIALLYWISVLGWKIILTSTTKCDNLSLICEPISLKSIYLRLPRHTFLSAIKAVWFIDDYTNKHLSNMHKKNSFLRFQSI